MGLLGLLRKKSYDIPMVIEGVSKSGGQDIVEIPFEAFVSFVKDNNLELLPSHPGTIKCKETIFGKEKEIEFIAGTLHHQLNDNETFVRVKIAQSIAELFGTEDLDLIARKLTSDWFQGVDEDGLALALLWKMQQTIFMELQRFAADVYGAGYKKPEFHDKIVMAVAGDYRFEDESLEYGVYEEGFLDAFDKNIGPYFETEAFKSVADDFEEVLQDLSEFKDIHMLGNAILAATYKKYLLLAKSCP